MAERGQITKRDAAVRRQLLRIVALFLIGGGAAVAAITLVMWLIGEGSLLDTLGTSGLAVFGLTIFLLNRRGHYRPASGILVGLLALIPSYYILLEGPRCSAILLMVGGVIFGDFLLGGRSGIVVAVIECALYAAAGLAYEQGLLREMTYISSLSGDAVTVAVACFALALAGGYFTREMKRALADAHQQEVALRAADEEKGRLLAELGSREEAQRRLLERVHDLGNPIIPLGQRAIAMPIIGMVDARRAAEITGDLLRGVEKNRAHVVIVDITGVPVVDAAFGTTLLQMAQGVQLLGSELVLTGISPAVAEILVDTGLDFSRVTPQATLQQGLDYALGRQRTEKANGVAGA